MKTNIVYLSMFVALMSTSLSANAYYTKNSVIYDDANQPVLIDGVNWAGFQNPGEGLAGLWGQIDLNTMTLLLTEPWKVSNSGVTLNTGVTLRTVRIPISPQTLRRNWNDVTAFSTPDNNHLADRISTVFGNAGYTEQTFNAAYASYDPKDVRIGNDRPDLNPQFVAVDKNHMTQLHELIAFIYQMKKHNVKVLIDFHQNVNGRNQNTTEGVYTLDAYYRDVAFISKYVQLLGLTNVIGIDVFNEPNNMNWFGTSPAAPQGAGMAKNWTEVIATASKAVYNNNRNLLVFVEGANSSDPANVKPICIASYPQDSVGKAYFQTNEYSCPNQSSLAFQANWGQNFMPFLNAALAAQGKAEPYMGTFITELGKYGMSADQITWLMGSGSGAQNAHIVFSPHTYGQHVGTWQPQSAEALALNADWTYGFLTKAGYAVVIGESGYDSSVNSDKVFFTQYLTPYLIKNNLNHNLFFWEFPSDSGDTGGLLSNGDSLPMEVGKEQALRALFNATPLANGSVKVTFANIPATVLSKGMTDAVVIDNTVANSACAISSTGCSIPNIATGAHSVLAGMVVDVVSPQEEHDYSFSALPVTVNANQTSTVTFTFGAPVVIKSAEALFTYSVKGLPVQAQPMVISFSGAPGESVQTCTIPAGQLSTTCRLSNRAEVGVSETFNTITVPTIDGYSINTNATTQAITVVNGTASPSSAQVTYQAVPMYSVPVKASINSAAMGSQTVAVVFSGNGKTYTNMVAADNQAHNFSLPAGTYDVRASDVNIGGDRYTATTVAPAQFTLPNSGVSVNVNYQKVVSAACMVTVGASQPNPWWKTGSAYDFQLEIAVRNTGSIMIPHPWTLSLSNPDYLLVDQVWNLNVNSVSNGTITLTSIANWENIAPNNTITVGGILGAKQPLTSSFLPTAVKLNGQSCVIQSK